MSRRWRNWCQNEVYEETKEADYRDKVKHNGRSDQLFLEVMMKLYIHDHLINAIGSQKVSCLCLLDLCAAFDTYPRCFTFSSRTAFTGYCPYRYFWATRFLFLVFLYFFRFVMLHLVSWINSLHPFVSLILVPVFPFRTHLFFLPLLLPFSIHHYAYPELPIPA